MLEIKFKISFVIDIKFWATGTINLNFHTKTFEIEFLCFAIYISSLNIEDTNSNIA